MGFLQDFNVAINKVNTEIADDKHMKDPNFYNFIRNSIEIICNKTSYLDESPDQEQAIIHEDLLFETVLNFFKSIDKEFYDKAARILNNTYPYTKTYIYDFHTDDPKEFSHYCIRYTNNKAEVFLPLGYKLSKENLNEIRNKYGEDFYTIDDLYSVVHEISHLFDIKPENFSDEPSLTRDILTEITPGIFENFLNEYLLSNKIFSNRVITNKKNSINNKLVTHANLTRLKLKFAKIKREKGEITEEDITDIMINEKISSNTYKELLRLIAYSNTNITESKRYAFCGLYAPLFHKKCQITPNKRVEMLKNYISNMENDLSFFDILKELDLEYDSEQLKKEDGEEKFAR